jgi:hypothetical protein
MMPEAAFAFGVPIGRVWKDDSGAMRFEGVASSTALDSQKERMSKAALESMAAFRGLTCCPRTSPGRWKSWAPSTSCRPQTRSSR